MADPAAGDSRAGRLISPVIWLAVAVLVAATAWFGVRSGLRPPMGDFANYYAASVVARSGEDLTPAYSDFLWFQQQIDASGIAGQLGGFIPHPPAAALVMMPVVGLGPLEAKRAWTWISVVLLAASIGVIARLAGVGLGIAALATLGTGVGLANDFALGQVYVLLILSIAGGLLLVERKQALLGGLAIGALVVVKPVALPFIAYFALRREWTAAGGAILAMCAVTIASVALLGWSVHAEYLRSVLPHQLAGELQDPFHPLWQSWSSLGRRLFEYEPTLNAAPAAAIPGAAAALASLATVAGWGGVVLGIRATPGERKLHYALLGFAVLAFAPGGASYHMVLLALPYALFAAVALERKRYALLAGGSALALLNALPLPAMLRRFDGGWTTPIAYPRLWILCALMVLTLALAIRVESARKPSPRALAIVCALAVVIASASAWRSASPRFEDGARPVLANAPSGVDEAPASRPEMLAGDLTFLAANPERGRYDRYDVNGRLGGASIPEPQLAALSPDGRRMAFVRDDDIWVRSIGTNDERQLTHYPGIDRDPCWRDDETIVFATDRGRGLAYTTLYEVSAGK